MKARKGAPKAITATAHKIARLFYTMIRFGKDYEDTGARVYEEQYRARIIKSMQYKAQQLSLFPYYAALIRATIDIDLAFLLEHIIFLCIRHDKQAYW